MALWKHPHLSFDLRDVYDCEVQHFLHLSIPNSDQLVPAPGIKAFHLRNRTSTIGHWSFWIGTIPCGNIPPRKGPVMGWVWKKKIEVLVTLTMCYFKRLWSCLNRNTHYFTKLIWPSSFVARMLWGFPFATSCLSQVDFIFFDVDHLVFANFIRVGLQWVLCPVTSL